jgi:S-adenosylmethionine:tRNA ribosyltransferase-isomerase
MMEMPAYIKIQEYDYHLPEESIAKYPLESRDSSKLLFYDNGNIESRIFNELPEIVSHQQHLIFNDTKVIQARLLFHKTSGSAIEIFLLEPFLPSEYITSFTSNRECTWKCLVGNAKKWKAGILQKELCIESTRIILKAENTGHEGNYFLIRLSWDNPLLILSDIIEHAGSTPIPPYLNREAEKSDCIRYQTVYSANEGSVAAPTAGLHFTKKIIKELENKGVSQTRLTLHVGAGTFVPVKAENAHDHEMHTEHIYLNRKSIESLCLSEKKFIAVGTTSVRTLESLYHIAAKMNNGLSIENNLFLDQWEAYQTDSLLSRKESLECILSYMDSHKLQNLHVSTKIMIVPGYEFKMIDGIITNFHQPNSTLLLLIAAFIGNKWKEIYDYALNNNFRFLSYGDSSLLLKQV